MQRGGVNILSSVAINNLLLLLYQVNVAHCRMSISAAAAGGAAYGIGGRQGFTWSDASPSEAFMVIVICSGAGGILLVYLGYICWQMIRKYILKVPPKPTRNFVVEKKVKCRSGKYLIDEEEIGESSTTGFSSPAPATENI